jgi:hypothetical protein
MHVLAVMQDILFVVVRSRETERSIRIHKGKLMKFIQNISQRLIHKSLMPEIGLVL